MDNRRLYIIILICVLIVSQNTCTIKMLNSIYSNCLMDVTKNDMICLLNSDVYIAFNVYIFFKGFKTF